MAVKQFKAESKRLLELMINSIYTHKEIFLRELISNSSDAIDKLYYRSLTDGISGVNRDDFEIMITADRENRTLTVSDNGCGMDRQELENNLGTIARSGSLEFKKNLEANEDIDIIGQFGVGFYSAFMVSKRVTVISKAYGSDQAYAWESTGTDGYTITPTQKEGHGTTIILELKDNTEDENYDKFLEGYFIKSIVKKYSDFIRYPIKMEMEKTRPAEGKDNEFESYTETETLNSMVPIWRKNKNELTEDDYNNFYKEKFHDFENPALVIHSKTEGAATYNSLIFIPSRAPFNFYTKEYEKGLQLYANGVLIMDKCPELLPDHFSFVRGLVDSQDLSLNISREMLQHDRQLKLIANSLEKKIKSELLKLQKNQPEKYEEFFKNFGLQLKFGIYNGFGANKDTLKDLIMFYSSTRQKLTGLSDYLSRIKEDQKYIYYACGESLERIARLPQTERVIEKGYEILYLTDDIDEFALKVMMDYEGKQFKSVSDNDLGLETEEEKKKSEEQAREYKELFDYIRESLGDRVKEVRISGRLKSHPVCLTSEGGLSLEMEKVLNAMPNENKVKAEKILEINSSHPIINKLDRLYKTDKEKLKEYSLLLYTQALLIEGMPIEDPVEFSNSICRLMIGE